MARSRWPSGKVGIVLLPSGEQGENVLNLAREWTRMGLISAGLWLRPELVERARSGPPRIKAIVLGLSAAHELVELEVDLFETLARRRLSLVRLVKLRSAAPSREIDAEQDAIADHVDEYLSKSMPMATPHTVATEQTSELSRITLICAPTEFQLRERVDWANSDYGTVVVASPEDRSSPWSGDAFVRDNERFTGFALMHLVTLAGLWNGTDIGMLELMPTENGNRQGVWVSRVFANAVITEALGRRTAAAVLEMAGQPDSLLVDASVGSPPIGTAFIDDVDVPSYVTAMVNSAMQLDRGALAFQLERESSPRGQTNISIGEQLGSFTRFSFDKLNAMPKWAWRWMTSNTARALNRQLQSEHGTHVVSSGYEEAVDDRDLMLIRQRDAIFAQQAATRQAAAGPAGVSELRTTPQLWASLRELVFGSLDGSSDLSAAGFQPNEGRVPVFGRVSDVFPDPLDAWELDDAPASMKLTVDWHLRASEDPRARLVQWVDSAGRAVHEASVALRIAEERAHPTGTVQQPQPTVTQAAAAADSDADTTDSVSEDDENTDSTRADASNENDANATTDADADVDAGADADAEADADADADADTTSDTAVETDAPEAALAAPTARTPVRARYALRAAQARVELAEAELAQRAETLRGFDEWVEPRSGSFVWNLLSRMSAERHTAESTIANLDRQIDALAIPQPGTLLGLRKRFHRSVVASAGVLITLALIAIGVGMALVAKYADEPVPFWYPQWWVILLIGYAIWAFCTLGALAVYHRGWSQFQREVDVAHDRLQYIAHATKKAKRESRRLASLHRQAVEWLILLAQSVRQPWTIRDEWKVKPEYVVARNSMPFAMNVASVVEQDHASTTRLRRLTTEHLLRRGWRAEAFQDLIRAVGEELGHDSERFGVSTLDDDLPHASNNSRTMLRQNMGRENLLVKVSQPRLAGLMAEIQRNALHGSRPPVSPIDIDPLDALASGTSDAADGLAWDEFLLDTLVGRADPVPPLSTSWLRVPRIQDGFHEQVQSFLIVPERLSEQLPSQSREGITDIAASARDSAIDLVLRVDLVGPIPSSTIALWDVQAPQVQPIEDATSDLGI